MKNKKRTVCIAVLLYWVVCCFVVTFTGHGMFEALGAFCSIGGSRDKSDVFLAGILDVVTAPLQVTVLWPCYLIDHLYKNTGERMRRKEEAKREQVETLRYLTLLNEDGERMFTLPDFQCPTNRAALSALNEWICTKQEDETWCAESLPRCAEYVLSHTELMPAVVSIWRTHKLDAALQHRGLIEAVKLAEKSTRPSPNIRLLLENVMGSPESGGGTGVIPDDILVPYVDHPNELVSRCAQDELRSRWFLCGYPEGWDEKHNRKDK